jgi:hypothetical protein
MKTPFLTLLLTTFFVGTVLRAQDPGGAIEGSVTDKSAGAVAADVTATNLDTGLQRQVHAAENGLFRIPLLPVGKYRVTVEAPFRHARANPSGHWPQRAVGAEFGGSG